MTTSVGWSHPALPSTDRLAALGSSGICVSPHLDFVVRSMSRALLRALDNHVTGVPLSGVDANQVMSFFARLT